MWLYNTSSSSTEEWGGCTPQGWMVNSRELFSSPPPTHSIPRFPLEEKSKVQAKKELKCYGAISGPLILNNWGTISKHCLRLSLGLNSLEHFSHAHLRQVKRVIPFPRKYGNLETLFSVQASTPDMLLGQSRATNCPNARVMPGILGKTEDAPNLISRHSWFLESGYKYRAFVERTFSSKLSRFFTIILTTFRVNFLIQAVILINTYWFCCFFLSYTSVAQTGEARESVLCIVLWRYPQERRSLMYDIWSCTEWPFFPLPSQPAINYLLGPRQFRDYLGET